MHAISYPTDLFLLIRINSVDGTIYDATPAFTCDLKTCGEFTSLPNGANAVTYGNQNFFIHSTATVTCNAALYDNTVSAQYICDGTNWVPVDTALVCHRKTCSLDTLPQHASGQCSGIEYPSTCVVSCDEAGYYGSQTFTCGDGGFFSPASFTCSGMCAKAMASPLTCWQQRYPASTFAPAVFVKLHPARYCLLAVPCERDCVKQLAM